MPLGPALGLDPAFDQRGEPVHGRGATPSRAQGAGEQRDRVHRLGGLAQRGLDSAAGTPLPSSSPARRLRLPSASTVATRSPAPASPANVSGRAPCRRA